jgi:DNA-binding CsgD family transcriptional regulator
VRTGFGNRIWINVSTIVFDNRRTGRRLYVRLARNISQQRRNAELYRRALEAAQQLVALAGDESQHAQVEPLSEQERRILKFFAEGNNAKTIARKLRISPQTLRNHLHRINLKLRTHNRLEAVTHAQRRGLIEEQHELCRLCSAESTWRRSCRTSVPASALTNRGRDPECRILAVPRHSVAMMGVDLDGTILLLAPAVESANLRLPGTRRASSVGSARW